MAVVWGVGFAVAILCLSLQSGPTSFVGGLVAATAATAALLVMAYAAMRLRVGGSVCSNALKARGYPVGDPDRDRRLADPDEVEAWKRYRRGEIDRLAYEHARARRRFAHGEISVEEFREIARELDEARAGGFPPAERRPL